MKNRLRLLFIVMIAPSFGICVFTRSGAQQRQESFSHSTSAHKQGQFKDCSACHTMPTTNWRSPRADKLEPFPDVVHFPYQKHTTCNVCHSKGAKPDLFSNGGAFCGNCHVVASQRATGGRGVRPFPNRSHARQFVTRFPHNLHVDVMARNNRRDGMAVAHFLPARFELIPNKVPGVNNCTFCHKTATESPKFADRIPTGIKPLSGGPAETAVARFAPKAGFFKDSPKNHASCFSCHYQGARPGSADCAGCHTASAPYSRSNVVRRTSLKFDHQQKDHAKADCVSCHLRLSQPGDGAATRKPDVPILACLSCHTPHADDLAEELSSRESSVSDKKPIFQCIRCHTSAIGSFPVPASHRIQ
jgi:hypothetical protein